MIGCLLVLSAACADPTETAAREAVSEIEEISPPSGSTAGGTEVEIRGDLLAETGAVRLGDAEAEVLDRTDARIVVVAPPGEPGTVDVVVEGPDGDLVVEEGFRYDVPAPLWAPAEGALPAGEPNARTPLLVDLDGDGDLDLFLAVRGEPSWVLANDGAGTFLPIAQPAMPIVDALDAAAGDLDGDGDVDVYVAVFNPIEGGATGRDVVLWNDGSGVFAPSTVEQAAEIDDRTTGVALGDVDGDGDLDVATANWQAVEGGAPAGVRLLVNDGGTFADATSGLPSDQTMTFGVLLFDADGDGDLDLYGASDGAAPRLLLGDGSGAFEPAPEGAMPADARTGRTPAALDFDGDGDVDVALATTGGGLHLFENDGSGRFRYATGKRASGIAGHCERVTAADADGDGDVDLILARWDLTENVFLRNDGAGLFWDWRSSLGETGDGTDVAFAAGDVDSDGGVDLVLSRSAAPPLLLLQSVQ